MFLMEIPAGASTTPVHHLYEAIYFVLEGTGSTEIALPGGGRRSFEWGPRSFFAIPLNATHRHFNGSGTKRALLCSTTTMPLVMTSSTTNALSSAIRSRSTNVSVRIATSRAAGISK